MLTSWNQALLNTVLLSHHQKGTHEKHENMNQEECKFPKVKWLHFVQTNVIFKHTRIEWPLCHSMVGFVLFFLACSPITILTEMLGQKKMPYKLKSDCPKSKQWELNLTLLYSQGSQVRALQKGAFCSRWDKRRRQRWSSDLLYSHLFFTHWPKTSCLHGHWYLLE